MEVKVISKEAHKTRRQIAITIVSVMLLIALLFIYYFLTKPPRSVKAARPTGYSHILSIYGYKNQRLSKPVETAVGPKSNIYIADTFNHRVMVFSSNGRFIKKFGKKGKGKKQLYFPNSIAVDSRGVTYVAVSQLDKVVMFSPKGSVFWEIAVPSPQAITIVGNRLYIATKSGVMIGTNSGKLLTSFSSRGREKGKVDYITGIAISKGNIIVADSGNYRIQAFTKDGESLWTSGKPLKKGEATRNTKRKYSLPAGLATDSKGNIYVVDAFAGKVVVLDPKGRDLRSVGDWGREDGQFYYPAGISYLGNDRFVVADKFNNRVQIVRIALGILPLSEVSNLLSPIVFILILTPLLMILVWQWYRFRPVALQQANAKLEIGNELPKNK